MKLAKIENNENVKPIVKKQINGYLDQIEKLKKIRKNKNIMMLKTEPKIEVKITPHKKIRMQKVRICEEEIIIN